MSDTGGLVPPGQGLPPPSPESAHPPPSDGPPPTPHGASAPPPAGTDTGLGWTGLGLAAAFCVPCVPVAGAIVALVVLVRRRFRPRWLAVLALALGIGATVLQVAAVPRLVELARDGVDNAVEQQADDVRESGRGGPIVPSEMRTGDCLDDANIDAARDGRESMVQEIMLVPCDQPHDAEVFGAVRVPGEEFPGARAVDRRTLECLDLFARFTGARYSASSYEVYFYYPTEQSWEILDDRTIQCAIHDPAGQTTGSLKGSGRGDVPQPGERAPLEQLVVGDCFDLPADGDESGLVTVRSCRQEHYGEVFAVIDLKDGPFPGDDEADRLTQARCTRLFARFIGIPYDDSAYVYAYWTPDAQTWSLGDRTSICAVHDEDDLPLKGSLRGARG